MPSDANSVMFRRWKTTYLKGETECRLNSRQNLQHWQRYS